MAIHGNSFWGLSIRLKLKRICALTVLMLVIPSFVYSLPQSAEMKNLSLPNLLAMRPDHNDPLRFDFLVDRGLELSDGVELKDTSEKLIKYFMAAMTIPDNDSWVNLSPYEQDRIIPDFLGSTEMGKTMLGQDYLLKQKAAALTNPETDLGQAYWQAVQKYSLENFGTSDIPASTFNKVWIVPDQAVVVENNGYVFVVESRLKVLMDQDYLAMSQADSSPSDQPREIQKDMNGASSRIFQDIILPVLETEVNEAESFAPVRQIYHGVILAAWYKKNLRDSLLGQVYLDKNKISGVETLEKNAKAMIYEQYLETFRKGAYSLIKEDWDPATQEMIPRKYFSGGTTFASTPLVEINVRDPRVGQWVGQSLSQAVLGREIAKVGVQLDERTSVAAALKQMVPLPQLGGIDATIGPFGHEGNLTHGADKLNEKYDLYRALDAKANESVTMLLLGPRRGVAALELALQYPGLKIIAVNQLNHLWNDDMAVRNLSVGNYTSEQIQAARNRITVIENVNLEDEARRELILGDQTFDFVVIAENYTMYLQNQMQLIEQLFNDTVKPGGFYAFQVAPAYVAQTRSPEGEVKSDEPESEIMMGLESNQRLIRAMQAGFENGGENLRTELTTGQKGFFTVLRNNNGQAVSIPLEQISSLSFPPRQGKNTYPLAVVVSRYGLSAQAQPQIEQAGSAASAVEDNNDFTKGGIDFNPANIDLQIKRDGKGMALPLSRQNIAKIEIQGFYPAILSIEPALMDDFDFK